MEFDSGDAVKTVHGDGNIGALGIAVSTQKTRRSAISWMHYWISALKGEMPIEYAWTTLLRF